MLIQIFFYRLSFIGHSLGGLIIRACLHKLPEYFDKFFTFLTFSSPHLGFMFHSSKKIDIGKFFIKIFNFIFII
jgi:hypothetical protein